MRCMLIGYTPSSLPKSFYAEEQVDSSVEGSSVIKLIAEEDIILPLISRFAYPITQAALAETV